MSARTLPRNLAAQQGNGHVPFNLATLSGDEAKAREAGCDAYVSKPYSPRQLLGKVREFLA